jgi:hypothetical protein
LQAGTLAYVPCSWQSTDRYIEALCFDAQSGINKLAEAAGVEAKGALEGKLTAFKPY